jgi:hypothetical protein
MNMVAEMLLQEPAPLAIGAALWLATVPAMVVLASPAKVRNPGRALSDACAFLIGRPPRRPAPSEVAVPLDLFAADAASTGFAADAVRSDRPVDTVFRYAGPALSGASVSPSAAVSRNGAHDLSVATSTVSSEPVGDFSGAAAETVPAADRAPGRRSFFRRFLQRAEARREEHRRQSAEAVQAVRYAEEVRVAAEQAGYAADRWQEHWEAAAERVDAAFRAWQEADARMSRSRTAAAFGTPVTAQSPAEYADRERHLHLAVRAAAERGELPTSAVADALTGRGGWNARLHPVEQELVIQRAGAAHLEAVWRRAAEAEKVAWRDTQVARRNWQSLCQEAILAAAHVTTVRHLLPPEPVRALITGHAAALAQVA